MTRSQAPPAAALAALLALLACAGGRQWTKPGVSADQAADDAADCQSQAQQATRRDSQIDSDILASRGHDWSNSGTLAVHQTVFDTGTTDRADAVLQSCMLTKGYAPAK
jgi:hypothetical protein